MWNLIPDSVKDNVDKIMNLTIKDLEEIKARKRLKLNRSARVEIEMFFDKIEQEPFVMHDTAEFYPGSLGGVWYNNYVVFYGLNNLYPCVKVNNKIHLIRLGSED